MRACAPIASAAVVYALPQPDWSLSRAGASYVDIFPLMRDQMRRGMLAPDGLHPSAAAYAAWAEALRDRLVVT